MATDLKFDPVTKNIIVANGSPQLTESADTMVLHQDWIHFGEYWGGPRLGSLLWSARNFTGPKPEVAALAEGTRSLKVVAARGRIAGIEVAAASQGQGRTVLQRRFRDVRTNTTTSTVVRVGG